VEVRRDLARIAREAVEISEQLYFQGMGLVAGWSR
jgi:hypothetical protein